MWSNKLICVQKCTKYLPVMQLTYVLREYCNQIAAECYHCCRRRPPAHLISVPPPSCNLWTREFFCHIWNGVIKVNIELTLQSGPEATILSPQASTVGTPPAIEWNNNRTMMLLKANKISRVVSTMEITTFHERQPLCKTPLLATTKEKKKSTHLEWYATKYKFCLYFLRNEFLIP